MNSHKTLSPWGRRLACAAASIVVFSASPVSAQTINWGNTIGSTNVDSNGTNLDAASYTFQFGIFLNAFDPTAGNAAQWDENWLALDTSGYNDTPGISLFQDSWAQKVGDDLDEVDPKNPPPPVLQTDIEGEQAYIWIFNNQNADETSEYGMFTSAAWIVPTFDGSQTSFSEEWRISDPSASVVEADTIIFGGMHDVQGDGEFGAAPPTFDLQTATFLALPEPKASIALGVAALVFILRRRRLG